MKRLIKIFVIMVVCLAGLSVYAIMHTVKQEISVNEVASIDTPMFTYTNISYVPSVSGKNFGRFNFEAIVNKTNKQVPVSINILLFDVNHRNVGFATYCSEEDIGGDYAQMKLGAGASSPFNFNVASRYFAEDKGPNDVAYYAVLDDNPYCHIGGYDRYAGLTLDEIVNGKVANESEKKGFSFDFVKWFSSISLGFILRKIAMLIAFYVIQGIILNALHKRMFASATTLSYLPIASGYIAVKLAFGDKVGKIFLVVYFASFISVFVKALSFVMYLLTFASIIALIIDIVKLITKKYDLCYLEPYTNNQNVALADDVSSESVSFDSNMDDGSGNPSEEESNSENENGGLFVDSSAGSEVIDLNYSADNSVISGDSINPLSDGFEYDEGGFDNMSDTSFNDETTSEEPKNTSKEGESDLMDLFK